MRINIKPIGDLSEKISDHLLEPIASSVEEAETWNKDPYLKLSKYAIAPIEISENEVSKAIEVWDEIEKRFVDILKNNFNQTKHDFIQNYKNIREALSNKKIDGNTIIEISKYRNITYEVVWNITWVDLFVWQLPKISLKNSTKYSSIGKIMVAISYIETLNKKSSLLRDYAELFPFIRNIESRAQMIDKDQIENALIDGIRKTINRFRERPLNYFTESDIHSSLMKDIMVGNSKLFLFQDKNFPEVSLLHNEYPTNFRYDRKKMKDGYSGTDKTIKEETDIEKKTGDRGNYDLSILNRDFVKDMFSNPCYQDPQKKQINPMNESIKHIINKDIAYPILRKSHDKSKFIKELLYVIEVKFIHPFNARNTNMLDEVIKDNSKLGLTKIHSEGETKLLNLIFCSSDELKRRDNKNSIISQIKEYVDQYNKPKFKKITHKKRKIPADVINIFIESYIFKDLTNDSEGKFTSKPIISIGGNNLNNMFFKKLQKALRI